MIAATDYMKVFADQIRPFLPTRNFVALGTDGFGRSDTRKALRGFFEVDRHYVAVAALKALADRGSCCPSSKVTRGDQASSGSIRRSRIRPPFECVKW